MARARRRARAKVEGPMSLTTKPPVGDLPVRPDAPTGAPARPGAAPAVAFDAAAALRLLVEEAIAAAAAGGFVTVAPPAIAAIPRDPHAAAAVLGAWLRASAAASGAAPEQLAPLIERAYARVLELLLRLPGGSGPAQDSLRLTRDLILAALPGEPPPALRVRAAAALPLRLLVEELERAV